MVTGHLSGRRAACRFRLFFFNWEKKKKKVVGFFLKKEFSSAIFINFTNFVECCCVLAWERMG